MEAVCFYQEQGKQQPPSSWMHQQQRDEHKSATNPASVPFHTSCFFMLQTSYKQNLYRSVVRGSYCTHPESLKPAATELWRDGCFRPPSRSALALWVGIIDPFRRSATPSDSMAL